MSNLERIVGIKSMLSSALVSSHLPKTELAAANTEQREFNVVVIPAYKKSDIMVMIFYYNRTIVALRNNCDGCRFD